MMRSFCFMGIPAPRLAWPDHPSRSNGVRLSLSWGLLAPRPPGFLPSEKRLTPTGTCHGIATINEYERSVDSIGDDA
jgi:hypothetical protein